MDKDLLNDAREDFKLCVENEADQRKESLDDLEFALLGKQWPDDVKAQREKDGRPCLTLNRLPAFVKQVTNNARQNRPSVNVHPVGGGSDKDVARIYQDLIRNIENVSKADIAYDTGLDFAAYCGVGYWVVRDQYTCDDSFDKELLIERVANPFSIYRDYESKSATSDDWNRAFITDLYSEDAFKKRWKGADAAGFETEGDESNELWFPDKQIRVAEWWTREEVPATLLKLTDGQVLYEEDYLRVDEDGVSLKDILDASSISVEGTRASRTYKVKQKIISGVDVLEENDWLGKYIPIVPCYGNEFNINGKRYFQGLVRFAKDPARMFNYWRTASTELVALAPKAPFVGAVGAFATDAAKWQQSNNASLPYVEYDVVEGAAPPQRQPFTGVPAGALQEALSASDDMKNIMGLHDASLGARSNETSGRAIRARQREGDVSTFNFADNRNRAIAHTGVILVDLIPKHYSAKRMIRCIKEDGSTYAVPINQPVMPQQPGQPWQPGQPEQQFQPVPEEIPGITKIFDVTRGKYDVTVSSGPSFTSKREEAAVQMTEFVRAWPAMIPLAGDLIVKNFDWPGADELAERLKAAMPPQAQGQNPQLMQMQQQMRQMDGQAREAVGKLSQELQQAKQAAADKTLDAQLKAEELRIKAMEAETDRLKVQLEAQDRERDRQARMITEANNAITSQMNTAEQPPAM